MTVSLVGSHAGGKAGMTALDRGPFRADQVGSLLRPASVAEARGRLERGEISKVALREAEDAAIIELIAKQEAIGLRAPTDGECRRKVWSIDFFEPLEGVEVISIDRGARFKGLTSSVRNDVRIVGRLGFPDDHPMLDGFRFQNAHSKGVAKLTVPSPAVFHFSRGREAVIGPVYRDYDAFFADVIALYRKAVKAFYDAGCRYLQFDDTTWAMLCDAEQREKARSRGDDPDRLPQLYAEVINAIIHDRPADLSITNHACRGNFRSTFIASGGYEPIAETLLGEIGYDGYFLEYDTDRAGGFEPLRFLPKGRKRVVLGLVTSKFGTLEQAGDIKRRIEDAARFVALDQLCLSPQCGFASTLAGNLLAEEEQWAKLALIVEIAREVWGSA
jgi:5-methyltetrahydropteroyltriglutamate--homocysteine methyltransferase